MRTDRGYAAGLFCVLWIILGNYVLLNLFLAMVLDMFSNKDDDGTNVSTSNPNENRRDSIFGSIGERSKKKREEKLKLIELIADSDSDAGSKTLEDLRKETEMRKKKILFEGIDCNKSYYLFGKHNPIRVGCNMISNSSKFESFIYFMIAVSTLKLIYDTYLLKEPENSLKSIVSSYFDLAITIIFATEYILKSISMGFVVEKGTYLRES